MTSLLYPWWEALAPSRKRQWSAVALCIALFLFPQRAFCAAERDVASLQYDRVLQIAFERGRLVLDQQIADRRQRYREQQCRSRTQLKLQRYKYVLRVSVVHRKPD